MDNSTEPKFKQGDRVQVKNSGSGVGKVVGLYGPIADGGMMLYRIRYTHKRIAGEPRHHRPKPSYTQASEDRLELVAPTPTPRAWPGYEAVGATANPALPMPEATGA